MKTYNCWLNFMFFSDQTLREYSFFCGLKIQNVEEYWAIRLSFNSHVLVGSSFEVLKQGHHEVPFLDAGTFL